MEVILISGGFDSSTLLHYAVKVLGYDCYGLSFLYGQKHSKEVQFAQYQCELLKVPFSVIDLTSFSKFLSSSTLVGMDKSIPKVQDVLGDPQPSTYVPNRNMIFLSLAAAFAENIGSHRVLYGAQRHDLYGYWDTTETFLDRINELLSLNRKTTVKVEAPFINMKKSEILKVGLELGVDYSKTWTCYAGGDKPSRSNATSAERLKAFAELGLQDPLEYTD